MLLDAAFHVVFHPCGNYEAVLCAAVHSLGVDVVFLFGILDEPAVFLEFFEVLGSRCVDFGIVFVCAGLEVDFRFDDVVEALLVAFGLFAGLFGVEHVIGAGNHLFYKFFRRAHALERFYFCHGVGF